MSKIANLFLKLAESAKSRSSKWANYFLNIAQNMAHKDGAKLKIELPEGEGNINYYYEKTNGDNLNAWGNFYGNAGLFIKGKSEEIELEINGEKMKEISTSLTDKAKLKPVFDAKIAENLWGFGQTDQKQEQLLYMIMAGVGLVVLLMFM